MTYKYRVSLPGLKGFERIYSLQPETTLFHFHNTMRSDMDFPQNQIILFKAVDAAGKALARYSSVDLGAGTIDTVTVQALHKAGLDNFIYFYDTTNAKSVLLDFLDATEEKQSSRIVLESLKGPNPIEFENGYVAFEDLPKEKRLAASVADDDDDDDEDLDEEEDDEDSIFDEGEGEEVVDENED